MIQNIDTADTPNQGRTKINSNFSDVTTELNKKISNDGTTIIQASIDMGGNRMRNAGAGIDDDDYVTKQQLIAGINKFVTKKTIYVVPEFNQSREILYLDGTNSDFGIKTDTISEAFDYVQTSDATYGDEWSIQIPYKSDFWKNESFEKFGDWINMFGVGRPVIEIIDGASSGIAEIIGNSKLAGMTIVYKTGKELVLGGNAKIDDCDIFLVNTTGILSRKITIDGASVTRCRMLADEIILDATTGNYVDDCVISVENFINPYNNEVNATNKTISNLENYFETHSNI